MSEVRSAIITDILKKGSLLSTVEDKTYNETTKATLDPDGFEVRY